MNGGLQKLMGNSAGNQVGIIGVDNGDCALVVNRMIVLTADFGSSDSGLVWEAGERLALAMGQRLDERRVSLALLPEDWNWDDVLARCYPTGH